MKLVNDAGQVARFWSSQAAIAAAVIALQEALPIWETLVPENVFAYIAAVVATASVFLRVLYQNLPAPKPKV